MHICFQHRAGLRVELAQVLQSSEALGVIGAHGGRAIGENQVEERHVCLRTVRT